MRKYRFLVVLVMVVIGLVLGGCAGSSDPLSITSNVLGESGEVTKQVVTSVSDTSVAKEAVVHQTLQALINASLAAQQTPRLEIEYETVERRFVVNGQEMVISDRVPKYVRARDPFIFDQPLPTKPSDHPVWAFANNIGGKLIDATLWGYLGGKLFNYLGDMADNGGISNVNGDVFNITGDGTLNYTHTTGVDDTALLEFLSEYGGVEEPL